MSPARTGRALAARFLAAAVLAVGLTVAPGAQAGRACEARVPQIDRVSQGLALGAEVLRVLEAEGATVALMARAGQDLSRHGLRYSHLGFVVREAQGWRVLHKLNDCGSAEAGLYREGVGDFFLDDPHRFEAVLLIPTPQWQAVLRERLSDRASLLRLHERRYNLVAYPWSTRYQQSNQWVLEMIASARLPVTADRAQAQGWLRAQGYEPTRLQLGTLTRLGARVSAANIAFDDHPDEQRFANRIDTVTVESVLAFAQRQGIGRVIGPVTVP